MPEYQNPFERDTVEQLPKDEIMIAVPETKSDTVKRKWKVKFEGLTRHNITAAREKYV